MINPQHTVNVYNRRTVSSAFQSRHTIQNYSHRISAMGGYDTAKATLNMPIARAEAFLENNILCFVEFYVDSGVEPIWEGLISRITYSTGGVSFTTSIDEMSNRAIVSQYLTGASTVAQTISTQANNLVSQAAFGIKDAVYRTQPRAGGVTAMRDTLRDTIIVTKSVPLNSAAQSNDSMASVEIECIGLYQTLNWQVMGNVASTTMTAAVNAQIAANSNGSTFVSTDTSLAQAPVTSVQYSDTAGAMKWDIIKGWAEIGDGAQQWILGVLPIWQSGGGSPKFYFRPANTALEYIARANENLRVRSLTGGLIYPWYVKPDRVIQVVDRIPLWSSIGNNPTITYIKNIEYDQAALSVAWQGEDDITTDGAFNLRDINKRYGKRFGLEMQARL